MRSHESLVERLLKLLVTIIALIVTLQLLVALVAGLLPWIVVGVAFVATVRLVSNRNQWR